MLDLCWTQWHWDRFSSQYFGFPLTVTLQEYSTLISILVLPEGQAEPRGPFKHSNALSDMGEALDKEKSTFMVNSDFKALRCVALYL